MPFRKCGAVLLQWTRVVVRRKYAGKPNTQIKLVVTSSASVAVDLDASGIARIWCDRRGRGRGAQNYTKTICTVYKIYIEMWANAHRDGRPAEYRWRRLFNAAKFG